MLSDHATIRSNPKLEIFTDDVECAHGSTTGQINEDALFYLRSRGVPEMVAKNLILKSFLGEVLDEATDDEAKNLMASIINEGMKEN